MASFIRKAFVPPPYSEALTSAQWTDAAKMRRSLVLLSLVIDLALFLALRNDANISRSVVTQFAMINISVLVIDLALTEAQIRSRELHKPWLVGVCVVLEAFTIMVWIQATGSLTSYFIAAGPSFVFFYRWLHGFRIALTMAIAIAAFHTAAFTLELVGLLEPQRLFVAPLGPEYQSLNYQIILMSSFYGVIWFGFAAGNVIVNRLRERERTLAEVRAQVASVAKQTQHGRLTGRLIGDDFALGEVLGRGGMGEVYAARRVSDDGRFAVKVLHAHLAADKTALERFRREAAATSRIPREYVARIEHLGRDDEQGVDYIAMEYLQGEDLSAYLRRRDTLSRPELIGIARHIATALDAAHDVGVLHRDLKPQNIFLVGATHDSTRHEVRLLDFGMSKLLNSDVATLTKADALIGTVAYMAPEQALGAMDQIGPKSDLYAFACVVYRMVTGRLPFEESDLVRALNAVAHALPPNPSSIRPDLPTDVDLVFALGLAKKPDDRYASGRALVDDLEAALDSRLDPERRERAGLLTAHLHADTPSGRTMTAGD